MKKTIISFHFRKRQKQVQKVNAESEVSDIAIAYYMGVFKQFIEMSKN